MKWEDDIQYLKGVGPKRAGQFARLSVGTMGRLLELFPRSYIDYSSPVPLEKAPYDIPCTVRVQLLQKEPMRRISGGRTLFRALCADDTASLALTFFNNPYVMDKLKVGDMYLLYGRVGGNFSAREMVSPTFVQADTKVALSPIYPLTEGLSNAAVTKCVAAALSEVERPAEVLPEELLQKHELVTKWQALCMIHAPSSWEQVETARRRLIFEELFVLQLGMLLVRGRKSGLVAPAMQRVTLAPFEKALPFELTGAQKRAAQTIAEDISKNIPMNRLLQGDVGSGKTMVAAAGVYIAAKSGYQSVVMAPTEILARQHAKTLGETLEKFKIRTELLTGSVKGKARTQLLEDIASGEVQLIVGTHAVLSEPVNFCKLGFAVTDEQHRFGVRQRAQLTAKIGENEEYSCPHTLVMSATPIPRTLALLMFGDLDVSVLDELPPGRKPVKTRVVPHEKRRDMFGFLHRQVKNGRQVYIVCPLIEEGANEMKAAAAYIDEVARPLLPGVSVGLMHGRLKAAEKQQVMQSFKEGQTDVLVSTTVIEVGVDVPNATVMVIENAERYGLSALHQLRGRVGRGSEESWCFLLTEHMGEAVQKRLHFLCDTQDGFEVAKYDLQTRGPGDFFGSRQHGLPTLRIANLASDIALMELAKSEAAGLLQSDPELSEHLPLHGAVRQMFEQEYVPN